MASDLDLRLGLGQTVRKTLTVIQENERLNNRTQNRLVTGKKINSIKDGVVDYFRVTSLNERVDLFLERKIDIEQGVSTLQAHNTSIETLSDLIRQLRGYVNSGRGQPVANRLALNDIFKEVAAQIVHLVNDTEYGGINLLASDTNRLIVRFSDVEESRLEVGGREVLGSNVSTGALFSIADLFQLSIANFNFTAIQLDSATFFQGFSQFSSLQYIDSIDALLTRADERLQDIERDFGNRTGLLQTRSLFVNEYSTKLLVGSEKISLADLNAEAANSKSLALKHEISITSISNSYRTQQILLKLVGN